MCSPSNIVSHKSIEVNIRVKTFVSLLKFAGLRLDWIALTEWYLHHMSHLVELQENWWLLVVFITDITLDCITNITFVCIPNITFEWVWHGAHRACVVSTQPRRRRRRGRQKRNLRCVPSFVPSRTHRSMRLARACKCGLLWDYIHIQCNSSKFLPNFVAWIFWWATSVPCISAQCTWSLYHSL